MAVGRNDADAAMRGSAALHGTPSAMAPRRTESSGPISLSLPRSSEGQNRPSVSRETAPGSGLRAPGSGLRAPGSGLRAPESVLMPARCRKGQAVPRETHCCRKCAWGTPDRRPLRRQGVTPLGRCQARAHGRKAPDRVGMALTRSQSESTRRSQTETCPGRERRIQRWPTKERSTRSAASRNTRVTPEAN
jgi:hypothetical protein